MEGEGRRRETKGRQGDRRMVKEGGMGEEEGERIE